MKRDAIAKAQQAAVDALDLAHASFVERLDELKEKLAEVSALLGARGTSSYGDKIGLQRHPLHRHKWHFHDQYGYVLTDVRAVTPVPCKGHQRWWTVPDALLAQLKDQTHD